MTTYQYEDADGTWESTDDRATWQLVDASQAFRDKQASGAAKPAAPDEPETAVEVDP